MVVRLLGPPQLRHIESANPPTASDNETSVQETSEVKKTSRSEPPMTRTENNAATYESSGDPCLDFFFHVVPDTPATRVRELLKLAWAHNPLTTLKLICNLRGVRGTGKSDKEGGYSAVSWLHDHHPQTLAKNIAVFASFGYYRDPLEILYRLIEGKSSMLKLTEKDTKKVKKEMREAIKESREATRLAKAQKALEKFNNDVNYQRLHESVSDFFSERLKEDMKTLESKHLNKISLAAKWAPTPNRMYDRSTLICESIARKMFPRDSSPDYADLEEAHYAYRIRDRLKRQVLVPLRQALQLPEVYMSARRWNELPYNHVPSIALKSYQQRFRRHDEERFTAYLGQVRRGEKKIASGALLPHEIIEAVNCEESEEVAELQWKSMVEDMSKEGLFSNCLAVSDVSGSMDGIPMEVSVALGILTSELSESPWKGKLITFSEEPELCRIKGETLKEKNNFVRAMPWGMNTDFQKVFDKILKIAVAGKLKPEQMIKKLFVFSDMEFDEARGENEWGLDAENVSWETDYQAIVRKFDEHGYGSAVPKIIFWNLRNSVAIPVAADQKGVALVSGFSKNMMKVFLKNDGDYDPVEVMEIMISGEEYQQLVVVD